MWICWELEELGRAIALEVWGDRYAAKALAEIAGK